MIDYAGEGARAPRSLKLTLARLAANPACGFESIEAFSDTEFSNRKLANGFLDDNQRGL